MTNKPKTKGMTTKADAMIGERLRLARKVASITQHQLAGHIGITYQQVQKYEKGRNRIAASRLLQFADLLEKPVEWFYEPAIDAVRKENQNVFINAGEAPATAIDRDEKRIYRFGKIIADIPNPKAQKLILALARELGTNRSF